MLKKILIGLVVVVVALAAACSAWLGYMGFFSKINVSENELGPLTIVYVTNKGPYSDISPAMMTVSEKLKADFNVTPSKGIGIYYDDPSKIKPADLRSDIGILLEGKDAAKADVVMKKMKVKIMFRKKYATAEFPIKNNMSYMIGAMKVYPVLMGYIKANGYKMTPAIEIYDIKANKITYACEIKR